MQATFWSQGLRFECQRCSGCCRHDPGFVFLSSEDLYRLIGKNGIAFRPFIDKYTRPVDIGTGWRLSLVEKPGYDCVFWENGGCSVYDARPVQCRTYPFWPGILDSEADWRREANDCPGIGRGSMLAGHEIATRLMARIDNQALEFPYSIRWETIDENTILGRSRFPADSDNALEP